MTDASRPIEASETLRNPELLSASSSRLLVVDVQKKLLPLIPVAQRLIHNCRRLLDGAKVLRIPTVGTEQYPKGLGPTTPELAELVGRNSRETYFQLCPRARMGGRGRPYRRS